MAAFFDDKEDVIEIELTEWGKYLFSIGKLKPVYYAFSDDEVLYDNTYGGLSSEEQKEIEDRIMNNTPYLKPHVRLKEAKPYYQEYDSANDVNPNVFADPLDSMTLVDTEIENKVDLILLKNSRYSQSVRELQYLVRNRLGSVRTTTQDYPAFDLNLIRSSIATSSNSMATDYGYLKIPQVDVNLQSVLTVVPSGSEFVSRMDKRFPDNQLGFGIDTQNQSTVFPDGSTIYLENNFIALELIQNGAEYKNKNFNVEIFEYTQESGSFEMKKLKMPMIEDGVDEQGFLRPRDPVESQLSFPEVPNNTSQLLMPGTQDADLLETYFSMQLDRQIPDEVICALSKELSVRGGNLRLDYDIECSNSKLSFDQDQMNKNLIAPGVEISQPSCDEEQGGPGCRN
jgi:hypothetical protein